MHLVVGLIVVAAVTLLFLFLLLLPALALQGLLRVSVPSLARRPSGTDERLDYVPIEEMPTGSLELLRAKS